MSFIQECPNCHEERIEKFKKSSLWDKEENKLCDDCKQRHDDKQFDLQEEFNTAKECIRKQKEFQSRLVP